MGLFPFTKWVFLNDYYLLPMEKNPGYRNGVCTYREGRLFSEKHDFLSCQIINYKIETSPSYVSMIAS